MKGQDGFGQQVVLELTDISYLSGPGMRIFIIIIKYESNHTFIILTLKHWFHKMFPSRFRLDEGCVSSAWYQLQYQLVRHFR